MVSYINTHVYFIILHFHCLITFFVESLLKILKVRFTFNSSIISCAAVNHKISHPIAKNLFVLRLILITNFLQLFLYYRYWTAQCSACCTYWHAYSIYTLMILALYTVILALYTVMLALYTVILSLYNSCHVRIIYCHAGWMWWCWIHYVHFLLAVNAIIFYNNIH